MKKKLINLFAIFPIIIYIITVFFLPDTVPIHFGSKMQADRMSSKYFLLILPIIVFVIIVSVRFLLHFIKNKDEKYSNKQMDNNFIEEIALLAFEILMNVVLYVYLIYIIHDNNMKDLRSVDFYGIVTVCLSIFVIVLSLIMPKTQRNGYIGVRTKESLYNEETWRRSNRFGAIFGFIIGSAGVCIGLFWGGILGEIIFVFLIIMYSVVCIIKAHKIYLEEIRKKF